jgi:sodium-dependent phosphate transporter
MSAPVLSQYYWMTVAAPIFGFWYAFGIGANDCANAFATSVAAKSVSLRLAVCIAAVMEFGGAMLLGSQVTKTIRNDVVKSSLYSDEPEVLMYGMLCALVAASIILQLSNYLYMPVSTTHTIVGAIVGFSLAAKGFSSINWNTCILIFISWVASPLITGIAAYISFFIIRRWVLLSPEPYKRAIITYPLIVFVAVTVDLFFVFNKSGANRSNALKRLGVKLQLPLAIGVAVFCALIFQFFISPCLQRKVERDVAERAAALKAAEETNIDTTSPDEENTKGEKLETHQDEPQDSPVDAASGNENKVAGALKKGYRAFADWTFDRDVHSEAMHKSKRSQEIWSIAPEFDEHAEDLFKYLQVFTACLLSFAHGANDVANAIAPLSAVYLIYQTGEVESRSPVATWMLALGGAGIVVGLATYGYKLIVALGFHLTKLSPSRGFCIELCTSLVVVIASFIGIPISTTQSQVGGTVGAGFVTGGQHVDFWFFLRCALGWVVTFVGVCLLTAGIFAFSYFAPSAPGFAG